MGRARYILSHNGDLGEAATRFRNFLSYVNMRRPRRANRIIFSELRTALNALRGLQNQTKEKGMIKRKVTATRRSAQPEMDVTPLDRMTAGHLTAEESAMLHNFIIEEDADHLDEALLIAMDQAANDDVDFAHMAVFEPLAFGIDATTFMDLHPGNITPVHEMKLVRFKIVGPFRLNLG